MDQYTMINNFTTKYAKVCEKKDVIPMELFEQYDVKKGLRDQNGNGVVSGLTHISKIHAFKYEDGKKIPCDGQLWYRGYDVIDLVKGFEYKYYGFEEIAYLLLFG